MNARRPRSTPAVLSTARRDCGEPVLREHFCPTLSSPNQPRHPDRGDGARVPGEHPCQRAGMHHEHARDDFGGPPSVILAVVL